MENETKYFSRVSSTISSRWKEVPFDRDHWWYVQFDATLRTSFLTHKLPLPVMVMVDKCDSLIHISVVRAQISTIQEASKWQEKRIYVMDDLKRAAECNSSEYVTYKIDII